MNSFNQEKLFKLKENKTTNTYELKLPADALFIEMYGDICGK